MHPCSDRTEIRFHNLKEAYLEQKSLFERIACTSAHMRSSLVRCQLDRGSNSQILTSCGRENKSSVLHSFCVFAYTVHGSRAKTSVLLETVLDLDLRTRWGGHLHYRWRTNREEDRGRPSRSLLCGERTDRNDLGCGLWSDNRRRKTRALSSVALTETGDVYRALQRLAPVPPSPRMLALPRKI